MATKISIVMPCYMTEGTVIETLKSIDDLNYINWEGIIVNDGSPDNLESVVLNYIKDNEKFRYFKKENEGLAKARNYGISKASGDLIIPLDSDNKIESDFLNQAVEIFEKDKEIGVVYGNAIFFGERTGIWKMGEFDAFRILNGNYIDACAIFRRKLFNLIDGYDSSLPFQGHEDWDLWLQIMSTPYKIHYLNKVMFQYRFSHNSMIHSFNKKMDEQNANYIKNKHYKLYIEFYNKLYRQHLVLKREYSKKLTQKLLRKLKKMF